MAHTALHSPTDSADSNSTPIAAMQAVAHRQSLPRCAPCRPPHHRAQHRLCATRGSSEDASSQQQQQQRTQAEAPSTSLPSDPVELIAWGGRLPSRRRLLLGSSAAVVLAAHARPAAALGANFLGVTSTLLSLDGGNVASQLRLDTLVPVKGLKRWADYDNLFEFQYPAQWVADQTLVTRAARRAEQDFALDPPSPEEVRERAKARKAEPLAAFGPPGTSGEENISIIVAPIYSGFQLTSLGTPKEQANWLMSNIAPEGSGKKTQVVDARSRTSGPDKQLYYELEYVIESKTFKRHIVSAYTARDDLLYTFSAQCPEAQWSRDADKLRGAAASFQLLPNKKANKK